MLVLWVVLAVFIAWSWLTYPGIGHVLYDLGMALKHASIDCTRSPCPSVK